MTLQPGCPVVVAPCFHLPIDWSQRLMVGAGIDRVGQVHLARGPWRPPNERELGLLAPTQALPDAEDCLCVFNLPKHLLSNWWRILERSRDSAFGRLEGFDGFVAMVAEFLAFKNLAVTEGAAFELLVSAPGLCSIQDDANRPPLWGGLNLGEEAVSLVFLNLTASDIVDEMRRRQPNVPVLNTLGELAYGFLALCPDYQPVRLSIEPGEGFRLPAGGILVDACTLDCAQPGVLLWIGCKK